MWAKRKARFPIDPPRTREYYVLRSLFEEQFPTKSALLTVPRGMSIACSTPEAIAWAPEWKNSHEISGRAIDVHIASESFDRTDGNVSKTIPVPRRVLRPSSHSHGDYRASPSPAEVVFGMSPA